jgi:ABC-type nitrate/sulfonate/bicarbonate transport system permease component
MVIGGFVGTGVGVLIGSNTTARTVLYPSLRIIRNVPLLALVPLFLVWFGGLEVGIVVYIAFGMWVIYTTSAIEAVLNVDRTRLAFARTLGANSQQVFSEVILPSIVPNLVDATRVALGVAWAVALGGEYLAAQNGLGRLLIVSETYVLTGRMVVLLLCFVLLSTAMSWIVNRVGLRLTAWMPGHG